MKKMKVLIIMPWIKQGGAELIAVKTGWQLQKLGHKIRLAALYVDVSLMDNQANEIEYVTFGSYIAGLFKKNKFFLYFMGPFFLCFLIIKNIFWTDILFPHSLPSYWIAIPLGKLLGKKVIWLCNEPAKKKGINEVGFADWFMWRLADSFLDRFLVRRIDQIIVYSQLIRKEVKKRYTKKADLIRLGIDYNFFSKREPFLKNKLKRKYKLSNKFVFLMVGKLSGQKNQQMGLEVLAELKYKITEAVLVLVGDGPGKDNLKLKAKSLKLEDKVIFAGFGSHKIVRAWYDLADLILYPSVGQTAMADQSWGFVPFEALCQKKLSIVSQNSGAGQVIKKEKIGFVCPLKLGCFTLSALNYYKNRKKYQKMAGKGKQWVKDNLSWEKFGQGVGKKLTC